MAINTSITVYSALSVCIDNHVLLRATVIAEKLLLLKDITQYSFCELSVEF